MGFLDWLTSMQNDVSQRKADREESRKAAQRHQRASNQTPDTKEDFRSAEFDAVSDAIDEGYNAER